MNQGGMTNSQYNGMLVDMLADWKQLKRIAEAGSSAEDIQAEIVRQIEKINRKLRL